MSLSEIQNLDFDRAEFWLERLEREREKEAEAIRKASKKR